MTERSPTHGHPPGYDQPPTHDHDQHAVEDPRLGGRWEMAPVQMEGAATHIALLHTHKILAFGGSSQDPDALINHPPAELLDLRTWTKTSVPQAPIAGDIFCSGHTLLEDGRVLVAGGTKRYINWFIPKYWRVGRVHIPVGIQRGILFEGLKDAYLFDPETESWSRLPDMIVGRWYPTLIRLADNSVLCIAGLIDRHPWWIFLRTQEVYRAGTWSRMKAKKWFPLYPRLHLLPDGDVFYSGVYNLHFEFPWTFPSARWDHRTGRWRDVGGHHVELQREEGISVLLALRPRDNYAARVLIAGGGHYVVKTAVAECELIDLSAPVPRWQQVSSMCRARIHANGVLLPDGQVLAVGGKTGHIKQPDSLPVTDHNREAVRTSEMFDPVSCTWRLMAKQERDRTYHSTAVLLPDGRVVSMGSNPGRRVIERSIEIYSPPYLFRGDRPAITASPNRLAHAQPVEVGTNRARQIAQVVLMRPEVVTHVTNTDQRLLELEFSVLSDERLQVQGPPTPAHMPQGYALLFLLDQDGVPSEGKFVMVG